jgi:hypothetical protein
MSKEINERDENVWTQNKDSWEGKYTPELLNKSLTEDNIKNWIQNWDYIIQTTQNQLIRELAIRRIEKLTKKLVIGDY